MSDVPSDFGDSPASQRETCSVLSNLAVPLKHLTPHCIFVYN